MLEGMVSEDLYFQQVTGIPWCLLHGSRNTNKLEAASGPPGME